MEEFASCAKCNYQTPDSTAKFCALCGGKMITSRKMRKLGWIALIASSFLVVMMVSIALWVRFSDATYEGTAELARYAITLGILIVALGVVGICAGVWQIRHGRRNKMLVYTMMALGWALIALIAWHEFYGSGAENQ